ncbi:hypothetical protein F4680DRAFT_454800 [Xylaria scruposa]|nr:hypothetical protein F4680DRAFT_454800 [Xylaria scruposa]
MRVYIIPNLLGDQGGQTGLRSSLEPSRPSDPTPHFPVTKPTLSPLVRQIDDPVDEDEEDEEDICAYEFSLPPPVYVDLNLGAGPSESISPPAPTPTPHPTPNPTPPGPDPSTEVRHCYNSGAETGRGDMINAVIEFCGNYEETVLDASNKDSTHTLINWNYYRVFFPRSL